MLMLCGLRAIPWLKILPHCLLNWCRCETATLKTLLHSGNVVEYLPCGLIKQLVVSYQSKSPFTQTGGFFFYFFLAEGPLQTEDIEIACNASQREISKGENVKALSLVHLKGFKLFTLTLGGMDSRELRTAAHRGKHRTLFLNNPESSCPFPTVIHKTKY